MHQASSLMQDAASVAVARNGPQAVRSVQQQLRQLAEFKAQVVRLSP